ncbi:ribokinase [Rhabdobacter roseus]|uniref:Ribokinase n=1 Tax=Rhabdobacter roseus TaxID=1655419 RepID=A0A840TTV0_9BACT|nr:ribokinase [Rhabdobacter roseus]MBB5287381.1 ribokinase [Rhabdobacter roseus]
MAVPICVIGSSNTDMVVKADRLPLPGETVLGWSFLMNPGGKGANQAVAAARLQSQVTFVTKVGNDIFGRQAIQQFQHENINTDFITTDKELPSGVALIGVDADGENTIIVAPGSNSKLDIRIVEQALDRIEGEAIVLMQLEIPIHIVEAAIEKSFHKGLRIMLNPAPAHALDHRILKYLEVITPNTFEAEMLTGVHVTDPASAREAAIILHELGVPTVVITLGATGAYLHTARVSRLIPAPAVTAIDTTASGDCFNGALAVALSEGQDIEVAIAFACKAASISVTRMGAQSSMPYRKEVNEIPIIPVGE